jgi:hypothetical protein
MNHENNKSVLQEQNIEEIDNHAKTLFNEKEIENMHLMAQQHALRIVFDEQCMKLEEAGHQVGIKKRRGFEELLKKMVAGKE